MALQWHDQFNRTGQRDTCASLQKKFFVGEILECAPERDPCFYFFGLFETVVKRILIKKVLCLSKFPSAVFNI